jgi:hypothetical protein
MRRLAKNNERHGAERQ